MAVAFFLSFQGKKTNHTSFIKYIIKKPNKAGGRKMGFSKMLELLQEKNKGYIILIDYNRIRKRRYNMDRRRNIRIYEKNEHI